MFNPILPKFQENIEEFLKCSKKKQTWNRNKAPAIDEHAAVNIFLE